MGAKEIGLIFCLIETGWEGGASFRILSFYQKSPKMSISLFRFKTLFFGYKNDAHFLTTETIFGVRGGAGAAIRELSREDKK